MPYVVIEKPEIVTISYRQTKGDKDCGSCLWARFYFDTKNYALSIESDCGSYSYGWTPTPDSETFLHLCSRFEPGYLLNKISNRSVVDGVATHKALIEFLVDYDEYAYEILSEIQREALENACHSNGQDYAVMKAILDELNETGFAGSCSEYDIACCIEMTYPRGAKKIVEIFRDHIQPVVRKLVKEEAVCASEIYAMPTVDAVEVVHGRWDEIPNKYMSVSTKTGSYSGHATSCSVCHEINPNAFKTNYCPNCGAKMDLEE